MHTWLGRDHSKRQIRPKEFIDWAVQDVRAGGRRGQANALGNLKRALHARMDEIIEQTRVSAAADWPPRPTTEDKLAVLKKLGVPPLYFLGGDSGRNSTGTEPACSAQRYASIPPVSSGVTTRTAAGSLHCLPVSST